MPGHFIVMAQPLYAGVPPDSHGAQMEFVGVNVGTGFIQAYHHSSHVYIDLSRNVLVARVLGSYPHATHLFFADQDVLLPFNAISTLLADDKDVASGVYFYKARDTRPVGFKSLDPAEPLEEFDPDGVQEVAGFGMGCILIRTSVFRRMEQRFGDRKWYRSEENGEDYHFCRRLGEMGIKVYLDGRVKCGHVGDDVFGYDDWAAARAGK